MRISEWFCESIAIDLGSVNTRAAVAGKGIVYRGPTVAAVREGRAVAFCKEAEALLFRAPGEVQLRYPIQEGTVADAELCTALMRHVCEKSVGRRLPGTFLRAVLTVPACVTEVQRQALCAAAQNAGIKEAVFLESTLAAALGTGMPEFKQGCLVAEFGGGTTNAAVIASGGVALSNGVALGGRELTLAIARYVRARHGVLIGFAMAEEAKCRLASTRMEQGESMLLHGQDMKNGTPRTVKLYAGEASDAISQPLKTACTPICGAMESTPTELIPELMKNGILLAGGGAKLAGLGATLKKALHLNVYEAGEDAAILGALYAAEHFHEFFERKRGKNAG